MMAKERILDVNDLRVEFKTRFGIARVLNGVSFSLDQGETLGIVGESGCGKSMTALAILGLVPPLTGRVHGKHVLLDGENLLEVTEQRLREARGKEISMIFQEPMTSLNPVYTVGDQIAETIRAHEGLGRTESMNRAVEMLRAVGIPAPERRVREHPHQMSGGMRQRVMIAMALACQPKVLIADEPTTALDVTVQAQIFDLLKELQERTGTAIILITHDMAVIANVAERVVVMYAGYKVEEGPVREIIANPGHPYTQGLLRCVPHLKMDPGSEREELMEIPGIVPDATQIGVDCPFHLRCQYAAEQCKEKMPPITGVKEGHLVACWFAGVDR
jgi:peptide/nickel transport system ATP-binding protein